MMNPQERRVAALTAASRLVPAGDKATGFALSTARQFDGYLASGLSRVGSANVLIVGVEGVKVTVEVDARLSADEASRIDEAVTEAVRGVLA